MYLLLFIKNLLVVDSKHYGTVYQFRGGSARGPRLFSLYTEIPFSVRTIDWELADVEDEEVQKLWKESVIFNSGNPWLF